MRCAPLLGSRANSCSSPSSSATSSAAASRVASSAWRRCWSCQCWRSKRRRRPRPDATCKLLPRRPYSASSGWVLQSMLSSSTSGRWLSRSAISTGPTRRSTRWTRVGRGAGRVATGSGWRGSGGLGGPTRCVQPHSAANCGQAAWLSAAIVNAGFTPNEPGSMAPSSTRRLPSQQSSPWQGVGSWNTRPSTSTTPSSASWPMPQPPSGCTLSTGPSGWLARSCSAVGSSFQTGSGRQRAPFRSTHLRTASWASRSAGAWRACGQCTRSAPGCSRPSSRPARCGRTSSSTPSASSWPIRPSTRLRRQASSSTASGSGLPGSSPPWRLQSPSGRRCSRSRVVASSSCRRRSAPGTANSCTQKGRPCFGVSWMAPLMVDPTRWAGRRGSSCSSARASAGSGRSIAKPRLSPLPLKPMPRRAEKARLSLRERSRISVDPRLPAASTTWCASSCKGAPRRACCAGSVCTSCRRQRRRERSRRSRLAPQTMRTPRERASRSKLRSSESLAPTLQPLRQLPQFVQASSITPAAFGPACWAMDSGIRVVAPGSRRCRAFTLGRADPSTPCTPRRRATSTRLPAWISWSRVFSGPGAKSSGSGGSSTPALISEPPPSPLASSRLQSGPTRRSYRPSALPRTRPSLCEPRRSSPGSSARRSGKAPLRHSRPRSSSRMSSGRPLSPSFDSSAAAIAPP